MVDVGTDTLTGTTAVLNAQEVVASVGRDRLPDFNDVARIPFITATIREAFRWRTIAPVAIPHAAVKGDIYNGYFIPKCATVFALSQYIHEDTSSTRVLRISRRKDF
ncbi:hypothetical protein GQ53DRAFT_831865 [Thozetella sp. PMI_491]|nr:hypothetical protein GQ53DRAFT_831865 [Thozetella sp. PMI_491]